MFVICHKKHKNDNQGYILSPGLHSKKVIKMLSVRDVPVNFQYYASRYCIIGMPADISEPLGLPDLIPYTEITEIIVKADRLPKTR